MKLLDELPQNRLSRAEENELSGAIQRSKGADQRAVNKLVLHSMVEAFRYAKKVCNARFSDEEIFSLCYKELVRSAKRFRTGYNRFFAFSKPGLRGAFARNWGTKDTVKHVSSENMVHLDWWKEHPGTRGVDDDDHFTSNEDEPREDADFSGIDLREKMSRVVPIMQRVLSDQEFMAFDLLYIGGFNYQEVADLLDCNRSAIQSLHDKGMEKIRAGLSRKVTFK